MTETAERTDPYLWETVKAEMRRGGKGGKPDQWSARKAQLAVLEYQKRGGGYNGDKTADNHLSQWTRQDWGTGSGKPTSETNERYLARKARERLTDAEYARTTAKKRADSAKGQQFSQQPKDVANKVKPGNVAGRAATKAVLLEQARSHHIAGRSRMSKAELIRALHVRLVGIALISRTAATQNSVSMPVGISRAQRRAAVGRGKRCFRPNLSLGHKTGTPPAMAAAAHGYWHAWRMTLPCPAIRSSPPEV